MTWRRPEVTYVAVLGVTAPNGRTSALEMGGFHTAIAAVVAASHAMGHTTDGLTYQWVLAHGGDSLDELSFEDVGNRILDGFTIERYHAEYGTDEAWAINGGLNVRPLLDQSVHFEPDECTDEPCPILFRHHNHIEVTS